MSCTPIRPSDSEERRFVTNRVLASVICLLTLAAPFVWNRVVSGEGPILCAIRGTVGLPCPGCGLTRAFCALARGEIGEAIWLNALSLPLLLLIIVTPLVALHELSEGRRHQWYRFLYWKQTARIAAASIAIYHVARLMIWTVDGTLVQTYFKSGLLFQLMTAVGG